MACPCGTSPCRSLPLNGGADWLYRATRSMDAGQAMLFRAAHAHPRETRQLVALVGMASAILLDQQPHHRQGV